MAHSEHLKNLLFAAYRAKPHGTENETDRSNDTNIHVSNLVNFCPRAYFLCRREDRSYHGFKHPGIHMGWTFDIGHALQKIQVQRLMTQQVIFGAWECRHCKHLEFGLQEHRRSCPKCKCRAWKNRDLGIELAIPLNINPKGQLVIRGNIDYVVATSSSSGYIVDAKSIKAEDFDALTDTNIEYKRQLRLYMWLANHKNRRILGAPRVPESASFKFDSSLSVCCYCVKGARRDPFKPYDVEQDRAFINKIEEKIEILKQAIESNTAPERICKSQANLMAKECSARTICFEGGGR